MSYECSHIRRVYDAYTQNIHKNHSKKCKPALLKVEGSVESYFLQKMV
jgi:Tfp pilus assembly protein PilE